MKMILQRERADCGCACLSMILSHFGVRVPYGTIYQSADINKNGTSIYGLCDGARQFGLAAEGLEGTAEELFQSIRSGEVQLPVIARIVNQAGYYHFVVIVSVSRRNVCIYDPEIGKYNCSKAFFGEIFCGEIVAFWKTEHFRKQNTYRNPLFRYFRELMNWKNILLFLAIAVMSVIATAAGLVPSLLVRYISDGISSADNTEDALSILALMLATSGILTVVRMILSCFRDKISVRLSWRMNRQIVSRVYEKMLRLPLSFIQKKETGDIINRFNDSVKIANGMTSLFTILLFDLVMLVFSGALLYHTSKEIFVFAVIVSVINCIVSLFFAKPLQKAEHDAVYSGSAFSSHIKQSVDGILTIKALNAGHAVHEKFNTLFRTLENANKKAAGRNIWKGSITEVISTIGTLAIFWVAAVEIAEGHMTAGSFIAAYTLLGYFTSPIAHMLDTQLSFAEAFQAAERLDEIESIQEEPQSAASDRNYITDGTIRMENVSFGYNCHENILNGLNLHFESGTNNCITGASGAGKSTAARLMSMLLTPSSGSICVSGKPLEAYPIDEIRTNVHYIPQKSFFFAGTVRENLLLGNRNDITDEVLLHVLKEVNADFIHSVDDLYSILEEDGKNLSGGQCQKLALARALLKQPKILILDEITANIDDESKHQIIRKVNSLENVTKIWISHDQNVIRNADHICTIGQNAA